MWSASGQKDGRMDSGDAKSVADISNVQCSSNVGSHNLDHDEILRRGCLMSHRSHHRQICVQVNAVLESVDFEVAWWWFVGIKSIHNLMVMVWSTSRNSGVDLQPIRGTQPDHRACEVE